jgi:hypothetical protein
MSGVVLADSGPAAASGLTPTPTTAPALLMSKTAVPKTAGDVDGREGAARPVSQDEAVGVGGRGEG